GRSYEGRSKGARRAATAATAEGPPDGRLPGLRHTPAMQPTQQRPVDRELHNARRQLDGDPRPYRWHVVLPSLSERLVAHKNAADKPGEEDRMADRASGPRHLRVQIRHDTPLDQHREDAEGEDGLRTEIGDCGVVRRVN